MRPQMSPGVMSMSSELKGQMRRGDSRGVEARVGNLCYETRGRPPWAALIVVVRPTGRADLEEKALYRPDRGDCQADGKGYCREG